VPVSAAAIRAQVIGLDDRLAAMIALRDAGKIGANGLSGVTLDERRRALPAGIACVQNLDYPPFSIDRVEDAIPPDTQAPQIRRPVGERLRRLRLISEPAKRGYIAPELGAGERARRPRPTGPEWLLHMDRAACRTFYGRVASRCCRSMCRNW
jgi:hypothetical protein